MLQEHSYCMYHGICIIIIVDSNYSELYMYILSVLLFPLSGNNFSRFPILVNFCLSVYSDINKLNKFFSDLPQKQCI